MAEEETVQQEDPPAEAAESAEEPPAEAAESAEEPPAEAAESAEEPPAEANESDEAVAEGEAADASQAGDGEGDRSASEDAAEGQDNAEAGALDAGEATIEALLSEAGTQTDEPDIREELSEEAQRILHLKVPVIVKLAHKMLPLGDIIDLTPGSIVEFSRSADQPLELLINNKVIGHGVAVKVGEKFGLRIEEILPVEETIRSLGN